MPCSQVLAVTCSHCHEEFIVRIAATTARELRDKLHDYVCPHCRKAPAALKEIVCAA